MPKIRLVAYDRSDLNGSPLGEITEAASKHISVEFNDYGDGQFQISRHGDADQLVWTRPGRYVRAWLDTVSGDPVASFFIEDSGDVVLAEGEDGVEDYVRQGRGPMRYLEEAIIWFESVTGSDAAAPDPDGIWLWPEVHPAGIMVRQLEEAQERGALPDLTYDFTRTTDSDGNPWTLLCDDFQLQAGDVNLGDLRGRLIELGLVFRMSHDFVLSAWEAGNVGDDLSGSITLSKGADIATSAEREQHWGDLKSTVLVKGKRGDTGAPVFVPVDSAAALTETTRRIEGYVDASETSGYDALQQIGQSAIYRNLRLHSGPTSLGVKDKTGQRALVDYFPGDTVTVDVPGIWNDEAKQVTSIALDETDNGEYDPTVGFDEEPSTDSGSGAIAIKPLVPQATPECCPPPGPFVPVIVTDDTCSSPTAAGSYGPNLSATSISPGNVFYLKPGFSDPGLVPNPGYVGSWSFAAFNSGGVDYAGDCTGNIARCLVIGDGAMVIHTATYSGSPRALTATLFHVVAGIPIADSTVHGTTGDDFVIDVSSHDGTYCTHYVDIGDDGGTCGGKWGFAGFDWTPATLGTVTNRPSHGQEVIEGWVGDGSTTTAFTNYPYMPGSLKVFVDGKLVGVTETDPTTGEYELDTAPDLGAEVRHWYQAASGTATGAGNDPTPDPYTPTDGGGGSSNPAWLVDGNAAPYSMVADDSTDASSGLEDAIADAVAAAVSAGVSTAVVELDEGVYEISGSLQTSGDYYCQVKLPTIAPTASKILLIIRAKHTRGQSYPMGAQTTLMGGTVVLHSTLTGGAYSGTHGWPSMIGGPDPEKASTFSNLQLHLQGVSLRQPANPSLCGVNGQLLAQMIIEDVRADTEDASEASYTEPTHPTGVPWLMPANNNNAMSDYRGTVRVAGYFGGIAVSEHTNGPDKVLAYQCKVGVNVQSVYYHGASLAHVSSEGCRVDLGHVDPSSGVADLVASGGPTVAQLNIGVFDIEDFTSGWASTSKVNIDDGNDVIVGRVGIIQVTAGVGTEVPMSIIVDGAANLYIDDLTQLPSGGFSGDAVDVDITDAGSYYTGTDVEAALQEVGADIASLEADVAAMGSGTGDHEHVIDVFNGDASTTAFEITQEPLDPEAVFAFVGGSWTAITVSGVMNTTVTFGSAPGSGTGNVVIQYPAVAA